VQSIRERLKTARFRIESQVAEAVLARKDLSYAAIGKMFGISESTVKEIIKRRGVRPQRKRGPSQAYLKAQRAEKEKSNA
jgi:DNA-directed RNA polymerase specialized sigma24 family protein